MITVSSLYKNNVFKNVSFEMDDGALCVLSKKPERSSALLDTLAGVRNADGGQISGAERVGYVAKGAPIPESLTAHEYLRLACGINGNDYIPPVVERLTEDIPMDFRIEGLTPLERLTVAVSASLIAEPTLVAIEEPYYGLGFDEYGDLKEFIRTVAEFTSVIFTSSSVYECKELSDKTLVLSTGNQIYFGDTETLFSTDINETDISCLIKGERDTIMSALERYQPEIGETVREGIYCVTVKSVPIFRAAETRGRIKKLLSKARLSLLDISSEKEALLNIIGELSENDRKRKAQYEQEKPEKIKVTKITKSLVAFSHDDEDDDGSEENGEDDSEESYDELQAEDDDGDPDENG